MHDEVECRKAINDLSRDVTELRTDFKHIGTKIDGMIAKMDHSIYTGNGTPGLMQRMAVLEASYKDHKEEHEVDSKSEKSDKSWVTSGPVIIGGVLVGIAAAIKAFILS